MNLSAAEVFGFSDSLIYFIRDMYDELLETGIDVDAWLDELEDKKLCAEYINIELKKMKSVREELSNKSRNALFELYRISSERLNALIFALSKKNVLGKKKIKTGDKFKRHMKKADEKVA